MAVNVSSEVEAPFCVGDVAFMTEVCATPDVVGDKAVELAGFLLEPVHVSGRVIHAGQSDGDRVAVLVGCAGGGGSAGKFQRQV